MGLKLKKKKKILFDKKAFLIINKITGLDN